MNNEEFKKTRRINIIGVRREKRLEEEGGGGGQKSARN